jgi:hypothetical protein
VGAACTTASTTGAAAWAADATAGAAGAAAWDAGCGPSDGPGRDYAALAGLAGYGREQYERLYPRAQREARLEIDRELALRRELRGVAGALATSGESALGAREHRRVGQEFDRALEQRLRESGHSGPRSRAVRPPRHERLRDVSPHDSRRRDQGDRPGGGFESPVLRDAYEVARRRKRQLGG